ncbi:MAG: hypothetical protein H6574_13825 [Lewinellaceae bacterium]|nr:hypothetical protein [Saprospiraceae bacterium]MCB9316759.1 hypothetical protein [Lewinellaceae bacterium]MCB9332157.1 hypothetical protein [Lewinellaceae bacterium]
MKNLNKLLRLLALVFLITLACIGIGLAGPVPLAFGGRKREPNNLEKTEQVEEPNAKSKKGGKEYKLQ